jgi:hypothetical protein
MEFSEPMIGGEHVISEVVVAAKWRFGHSLMFPEISSTISMSSAIILLIKACVSTDPFIDATSFSCGVIEIIIIGLVTLLFTQLSLFAFTKTWRYGTAYTFSQIWSCTLGPSTAWIPAFMAILAYVGFIDWGAVELLWYVGYLFPMCWPTAPTVIYESFVPLYLVFGILVLPCTLIKELCDFKYIGWACLFLQLLSITCVLMSVVRRLEITSFDPDGLITLFTSGWKVIFDSFYNFSTVIFVHPFLSLVIGHMERPTVSRCLFAIRIATTISFLLTMVGQFLSFCLFTDARRWTDIFYWLDPANPEVVVGLVSNMLISICSTGLLTNFAARTLSEAILGGEINNQIANFASGLVIVTFCCFMVFMRERDRDVMDVIACFCFILLEYAVPPLFYLFEFRLRRPSWSVLALIALVGGSTCGLISCGLTVEKVSRWWK